eukprot:76542-Prymnesium_polylepis.1
MVRSCCRLLRCWRRHASPVGVRAAAGRGKPPTHLNPMIRPPRAVRNVLRDVALAVAVLWREGFDLCHIAFITARLHVQTLEQLSGPGGRLPTQYAKYALRQVEHNDPKTALKIYIHDGRARGDRPRDGPNGRSPGSHSDWSRSLVCNHTRARPHSGKGYGPYGAKHWGSLPTP